MRPPVGYRKCSRARKRGGMGDVSPRGSVKPSWGRVREQKTGGARTAPRTEATTSVQT